MPFSDEFLRELDSHSPIDEIASSYVNLKRRGKNLLGLCPFHNEKTPSFNIYPENNSFYCFGCNKGGSVFQFVMGVENLAFTDAVRWLAQRAGMQVPEDHVDDGVSRLRNRIREINRESGRFFYNTLVSPEGKNGMKYFAEKRGLDMRTIRRFGLGYSPESGFALTNHLRDMGYTRDELVASDMVRISKNGNLYDRYRGRVMFPIFDLRGNVVAFGGRILTDEKPKYINTADTAVYNKGEGLFAMNFAKDAIGRNGEPRRLILAEGYMDVIALHRAGFQNAIASLGTALTAEQARIISRYADEVIICYDSDEAGQRATQRAIPILQNANLLVRVLTVPDGKDPDEFMKTYGSDGPLRFKRLLEQSGNDIEYRLGKIKVKFDLNTPDGKARYMKEAVDTVLAKLDLATRSIYAAKVAQEVDAARDGVMQLANRAAAQENRKKKKELIKAQWQVTGDKPSINPEREGNLQAALAEEGVIAYLNLNPDRCEALNTLVPPEKFVTKWNSRIYAILSGKAENGEINFAELSQSLTTDEISELTRIFAEHRAVPPTWTDVERYAEILNARQGFNNPTNVENASVGDIQNYLDELRKSKS